MFIIPIAHGLKKPAIYCFPGDQYQPSERRSIALIYSMYYFAYTCGNIFARVINPILRADVKFFGAEDSYPLIFGIFGCMNILILVLLYGGKPWSICLKASGSTLLNVFAGVKVN